VRADATTLPLEPARVGFERSLRLTDGEPRRGLDVRELTLTETPAPLRVRMYRPHLRVSPSPAVVFFHGGGFVLGGVSRNSDSGSGGTTGRSGNITVNNSGLISTSGENAIALLFQNASGGAYLYQNPDGTVSAISSAPDSDTSRAGEVVVTNTGVIQSTGVGGIGITKSTNANDTHGNLRVENAEGATIQGGPGGAAIVLVTDQV
jgi:hypothetical protein